MSWKMTIPGFLSHLSKEWRTLTQGGQSIWTLRSTNRMPAINEVSVPRHAGILAQLQQTLG